MGNGSMAAGNVVDMGFCLRPPELSLMQKCHHGWGLFFGQGEMPVIIHKTS